MSVDITGDGPNITATGSGSAITLMVTTGSGGGGGAPSGGAGGALSGSYPNPGLNTEAVQDLVGAMAGAGLTYDDDAGVINATGGGSADLVIGFMHYTNLNIANPHPFGAFFPAGTLIELIGQTDPDENGTYVIPVDGGTNPMNLAAVQVLSFGNFGRQVTVLNVANGPFVYGPFEWIVYGVGGQPRFAPQSGMTLFVQAEWDADFGSLGNVDFNGAVAAGALVFAYNVDGGTVNEGLFRFVADDAPMIRALIEAGAGTSVRVMTTGHTFLHTPHSGWVQDYDAVAGLAAHIADVDLTNGAAHLSEGIGYTGFGLIDDAVNVKQGVDQLEGIVDRWQFVSAYATTNVDLSTLVGVEAEVVSQPTLSDGTVPLRGADVRLFGQTNPAENGAYRVVTVPDDYPGTWVKYVDPDIFDPPGNGYWVTCNAPGTDGHGVTFMWIDDDRQKSRRVGSSSLSTASPSGEWVRLATPSDDLTVAPGGGTVDVVSNVATARILGRVAAGTGDSEELTAAQVRALLGDPWVTITDTTLESAAASFEIDTTGYNYLEVMLTGLGDNASANVGMRVRFNGDGGSNYSSNNAAASTAWNGIGFMPGSLTNTDRNGIWTASINLGHTARYTSATILNTFVSSTSTTGIAGGAVSLSAHYTNTAAAITLMSIYPSAGNWAAGTRLLVRGRT